MNFEEDYIICSKCKNFFLKRESASCQHCKVEDADNKYLDWKKKNNLTNRIYK